MSRTQTAFCESGTSPTVSRQNSFSESGTGPTGPLHILTVKEIARFLKISPTSVYELTRYRGSHGTNPIPHKKIGRYLKFLSCDVELWLLKQPHAINTRKRAYKRRAA